MNSKPLSALLVIHPLSEEAIAAMVTYQILQEKTIMRPFLLHGNAVSPTQHCKLPTKPGIENFQMQWLVGYRCEYGRGKPKGSVRREVESVLSKTHTFFTSTALCHCASADPNYSYNAVRVSDAQMLLDMVARGVRYKFSDGYGIVELIEP